MAVFQHDVLIIGAGLAGMRAGLAAQAEGVDVAIISKVHPVRSHSNALRKVALPEGWLEDPDADVELPRGAEALVSGG